MKGTSVIPPVHLTATYKFETSDDLIDVVQNRSGYIYSRWDNPSVVEVEKSIAGLEGYDHALGFGSGMAAITTAVMANIKAGGKVVATHELYGGTYDLLSNVLSGFGVETVMTNCWKTDQILDEIEKGLSILYLESPTNPILRVIDIQKLTEAAHKKGAVVMLDSTFASPVNQHPVDMGVDIVLHSATKYLGGHHDITAGFACCNNPWFEKIWGLRKVLGGIMDPMSAFLALRGLQTLDLRIARHNENGMKVAVFLETQDKIKAVYYPGLKNHPDHEIAKNQMTGFGGMLSFEVDGDFEQTKGFMDALKIIKIATSLGGVTSLATQPITNTHVALNPEERKTAGVSENLVRLSVGIENSSLLIEDLKQALETV